MKKFIFKLRSVLKYRKHLENLAQQEATQALMDVSECKEKIKIIIQSQQVLGDRIEEETFKGISAILFRQYNDYMESLENDITLKEQELLTLEKLLAVKQQALTKKSVERKVIERLREKKRAEYIEDMLAEEQKISDDISSLKKAREASHDPS